MLSCLSSKLVVHEASEANLGSFYLDPRGSKKPFLYLDLFYFILFHSMIQDIEDHLEFKLMNAVNRWESRPVAPSARHSASRGPWTENKIQF